MAIMIMVPVAMIMMCIGVHQFRSEKPVSFYSGEKPPKAEELTDVRAWNRRHGLMWIIYGVAIIAGWYISASMGDNPKAAIPLIGGVAGPLILMVIYHRILVARYMRK